MLSCTRSKDSFVDFVVIGGVQMAAAISKLIGTKVIFDGFFVCVIKVYTLYRNETNKLIRFYRKRLYIIYIYLFAYSPSFWTHPSIETSTFQIYYQNSPEYLSIHWSNIFMGNIYIGFYSFVG